jgi:hypothetical protein
VLFWTGGVMCDAPVVKMPIKYYMWAMMNNQQRPIITAWGGVQGCTKLSSLPTTACSVALSVNTMAILLLLRAVAMEVYTFFLYDAKHLYFSPSASQNTLQGDHPGETIAGLVTRLD